MKRIRAHHIICLPYWNGFGYTKAFTKNMTYIVNELQNNPDEEIEIVAECDDVCSECLFKDWFNKGECKAAEKIYNMDIKACEKLGVKVGDVITAQELLSLESKLSISDRDEICSGCSWSKTCLLNKRKM